MTRKAFVMMALVLMAATVATAAAAFAGSSDCREARVSACHVSRQVTGFDPVMQQVVAANSASSQAILKLKLKPPSYRQRGDVVLVRPVSYSSRPASAAPFIIPRR